MWNINITKEDLKKNKYIVNEYKKNNRKETLVYWGLYNILGLTIMYIMLVMMKLCLNSNEATILVIFEEGIVEMLIMALIFNFSFGVYALIGRKENKRCILRKYDYLRGEFKSEITAGILSLESQYKSVKLNLKKSKLQIEADYIIVEDDKEFRVILPIESIDEYDRFLGELKEWTNGEGSYGL